MFKKKITICVPSHNRSQLLGRCLRSLIDQSFDFKNYEIIVVDDGSNDSTELVLKAFVNDIVLIKNNKKIGLSKSLNKAIKASKGKYFLRVDSDDLVIPVQKEKIELKINFLVIVSTLSLIISVFWLSLNKICAIESLSFLS